MSKPTDLVQGTLDLLILKTLALQPMHGWGIAQRIRQISKDVLQVNQGALYPALHRLEQQGWIRAKWGESENNRRAKFYSLTPDAAEYPRQEQAQWKRLSLAIELVLETPSGAMPCGGSTNCRFACRRFFTRSGLTRTSATNSSLICKTKLTNMSR